MFTGLIKHLGRVDGVEKRAAMVRLRISHPRRKWGRSELGESIAVDGCCLTLAAAKPGVLEFDVVPETLRRTTLGRLKPGAIVHLERSMTAATLIGGHLVQGHVDGVGRILRVENGDEWRVRVSPDPALLASVAPKGSIALAGVSLTVARLGRGWFEVALVPTTLKETTLGRLDKGDLVNVECDMIAKMVVHWLERQKGVPKPRRAPRPPRPDSGN